MKKLMLVLPLIFSGCSPYAKCWYMGKESGDLKICKASPEIIKANCTSEVDDQGRPQRNHGGCASYEQKTLWVNWESPSLIIHELCHWYYPGGPGTDNAKKCDKDYYWHK